MPEEGRCGTNNCFDTCTGFPFLNFEIGKLAEFTLESGQGVREWWDLREKGVVI